MTKEFAKKHLTGSLEDYLETILVLAQKTDQVRVKDIAAEREVRAPSVSLALGKLSEMGLVTYVRREFVALTADGEREARKIYSRHQLLSRFFEEILQMSPAAASSQACAMEHVLTDDGMDRLTRFFEYLSGCPRVPHDFLEGYQRCPIVNGEAARCKTENANPFACESSCHTEHSDSNQERKAYLSLSELTPGATGVVAQIEAQGVLRQQLLDMGLLPDVELMVERIAPSGDPIWIKIGGSKIALRLKEAQAVRLVTK